MPVMKILLKVVGDVSLGLTKAGLPIMGTAFNKIRLTAF